MSVRMLLVLLIGCAGQDPHEPTDECAAFDKTCEWACAPFQEQRSIGGECVSNDGYRCVQSWEVAGTDFYGCCEVTSTAVVWHDCEP